MLRVHFIPVANAQPVQAISHSSSSQRFGDLHDIPAPVIARSMLTVDKVSQIRLEIQIQSNHREKSDHKNQCVACLGKGVQQQQQQQR